jgi:lipopolysaccharide transport system permease protein
VSLLPTYLSELRGRKHLILVLAARDIRLRYRQSALGPAWIVLQPALASGAFAFVFGRVANLPTDGIPYFVFAFSGLTLWNFMASTVSRVTISTLTNTALISKVYFPRLAIPLASMLSCALDFAVGLALLLAISATHLQMSPRLLLLPVWSLATLLLAFGVSTALAAANVYYRDVAPITGVVLQFMIYVSPVAYSATAVPASLRHYFFLNPVAPLLEGWRWSLFGTTPPPAGYTVAAAAVALACFFAGIWIFVRAEARFADVI